jgi:hypothetical protein
METNTVATWEPATIEGWNELAKHLTQRSAEICSDNECTEDAHHCDSYAYIAEDGTLDDICYPDYWNGWGSQDVDDHGEIAAIPLPWIGTGAELRDAVFADLV